MNNYFDKYGRLHDKPVTELNPIPSNNSWVYTAYYVKMGGQLTKNELFQCFLDCMSAGVLYRSPGKANPPMSRDEILGLVYLGQLTASDLQDHNWDFSPKAIPKFNLITLVKQLWQLRPGIETNISGNWESESKITRVLIWKHRNYFWQNNLDQLYRFAFSVPYTDRHFILQKQGKFNLVYWAIAKIDSLFGKDSGIRYLKYGKSKEAMLEEFPADHPIRNL